MGLDTYAAYSNGHPKHQGNEGFSLIPSELFPENHLCGGMLSGGGNSFRGKVYDNFITEVTGISLYNEELSTESVSEIVSSLERHIEVAKDVSNETKELLEWFKVVEKEEASVIGWW